MTAKRVFLLDRAERDIEETFEFYGREAGSVVAAAFVERYQAALRAIGEHPAIGSTRYADELDVPGVRSHPLKRFPYLVIYVEYEERILVARVLHAQRDIAAGLEEP